MVGNDHRQWWKNIDTETDLFNRNIGVGGLGLAIVYETTNNAGEASVRQEVCAIVCRLWQH